VRVFENKLLRRVRKQQEGGELDQKNFRICTPPHIKAIK
jgi:hypothetical protein